VERGAIVTELALKAENATSRLALLVISAMFAVDCLKIAKEC
jgi:hypothetical protein